MPMPIHAPILGAAMRPGAGAAFPDAGFFGCTHGRGRRRGGSARVLVIDCAGSDGEPSMLAASACDVLEQEGLQVQVLRFDARPPSLGGVLRQWMAAHGIVICTPACGAQPPFELTRMIDRLACSAALSVDPDQLSDRVYGILVQGEGPLADGTRRALSARLDRMGLVDGGTFARLDRSAGYYEVPCEMTAEGDCMEQVENVARAVSAGVRELRAGRLPKAPPRLGYLG